MKRKLLATAVAAAGVVVAVAAPASASTTYNVAHVPFSSPIGVCIGGAICGGTANKIIFSMPRTFVNYVFVNANDNVGDKHKARLWLYVDGQLVGDQDVLQGGSTLTYNLHRAATTITLESHGPEAAGDETNVVSAEIV